MTSAAPKKEELEPIVSLHRRGAGGLRIALLLTQRLNLLIQQIYRNLDYPPKEHVALVALGGYGRKELCFASDTDILFLVPGDRTRPEAGFAVQKLLYGLLDLGLDVGHSVRTMEECLALRRGDVESWVSVLESRFICGNKIVFDQLRAALAKEIASSQPSLFVREMLDRLDLRHKKYGDSSKLLEPNIKNSAGGLRDLHTAFWLMLGTGSLKPLPGLKPNATALTTLLTSTAIRKASDQRTVRDASKALDFILRTRNEMHLQGKGLHDTLEFTFQQQVAEALGYKSKGPRSSVERFMQDYFLSARRISGLTRRVAGTVHQRFLYSATQGITKQIDNWFSLKEDRLCLAPRSRGLNNKILLLGILHSLRHGAGFSYELEDAIGRQLHRFKPLRSIEEAELFREILAQPSGVADAFQRLNEHDVLSRWIPEWKGMVAFFQHNQYHYYTADEHTLRVVANAEALGGGTHAISQVFQNLPRRDILYLACLLHDITKPRRVGDHEVTGAETADRILKRMRYDAGRDVSFLVRHHLLMEQVAFRRNLSDPQTIVNFASKFDSTNQLDYLYVLTYADLSAVNKNVWTDWKGMLLHELYHKTKEILDEKLSSEDVHLAARSRHQEAVRQLVDTLADSVPQESSRVHLEAIDSPAYLATFDPDEIAEHIRHIGRNEKVAATFRHQARHTEITVIARDAPFLLCKFCGVLSANDANILDAHIFTRSDGIIIDKFRVTDFVSQAFLAEQQCAKILQELNDVLGGSVDIKDLLQRHRMKWRRRTRALSSNVRFDVVFEEHPRFTIIDLFGADMLGFLYKVTETMSRLGLNIYFAKISTRADGIVDSFYVLDPDGSRIRSEDRKSTIRTELLTTMNELSHSELILT